MSSWLFALTRHKAIDLVRKEANVWKRYAPETELERHEADGGAAAPSQDIVSGELPAS